MSSLRSARLRPSRSNPQLNTWKWPETETSHKRTNSEVLSAVPHEATNELMNEGEMPVVRQIPSRVHGIRRLVGFRKYNSFLEMSSRALQLCSNIECLLERRQQCEQKAFSRVDLAIEDLSKAESKVSEECDRLLKYEQKSYELDFLRRNIEACIQKSIGVVKEQLPAFNAAEDVSCVELRNVMNQRWQGHSQYRFAVASLRNYIYEAQRMSTADLAGRTQFAEDAQLANKVREFVLENLGGGTMRKFAEAGVNVEILQRYVFNELEPTEKRLVDAVKQSQAVTEVLIRLSLEIRGTERQLISQAKSLVDQKKDGNPRDLYEQEELLYDVILHGREFEKQEAKKKELDSTPVRPSNALPPISPAERCAMRQDASPVWAQSWATSPTKILRNRRNQKS